MAIDPKLVSIKTANEMPTETPKNEDFFFYYSGNILKKAPMSEINAIAKSGIRGEATQTNSPTAYTPEAYPNGLFETYVVREPLTMPNSWGSAVTQAELDANYVFFDVRNGVITKSTSLKSKIDIVEKNNIWINSDFSNGSNGWTTNEYFLATVSNQIASINTNGTTNPAFINTFNLKKGVYRVSLRIKNKMPSEIEIRIGSISEDLKIIKLMVSDEFQVINVDYYLANDYSSNIFVLGFPKDIQVDLDYFYLIPYESSSISVLLSKIEDKQLKSSDFNMGIDGILVEQISTNVKITVSQDNFVFDMLGGYRILKSGVTIIASQYILYFSSSSTEYIPVDLSIKGTGESIYLYSDERENTVYLNRINPLGINYVSWNPSNNAFKIKEKTQGYKSWMPTKSYQKTPIYDYLKPFIQKMQTRDNDVTLVQIGDSISTDLNWTVKRLDANQRPQFCTEYNVNSFLEEKLRWKEQQYRRFDYTGVFTDVLGGGNATIKETDDDWFMTGASYMLPITKVIDGGTDSGVSFKMLADIKRLTFVLHSDSKFAASTMVTIEEGNGKVEVWNGTTWVEANGYTTSFKETELIPTTSVIRHNPHTRLKFRSLTDLSAKTITVQNIGAGRFAYWGIEYSPKETMFTYICSSLGSHAIHLLRRYEAYMVDAFNPDLVLQQCCVLNMSFGQQTRGFDENGFAAPFGVYYDDLEAKGYLVIPYILWTSFNSYTFDENGNFLYGKATSGKTISTYDDANTLTKLYEDKGVPAINLFPRITEVGLEKAEGEGSNIYSSAVTGSGQSGDTFTVDGIHMNRLGEEVVWKMIEGYFNF